MRFKATIFLSSILILLGAYLYFVELPAGERQAEEKRLAGKLFSFSAQEITRVVIRGPKGEIDLEQFPEHPTSPWRIFSPVETVANQQLGQALADLLTGIKTSRLVEAKPKDLADFGLDPPQFTVLITLPRNNTEMIEVGAANLTGTDVYIRKGMGTSLYLAPIGITHLLEKNLYEWRQREVFPYPSADINGLRLESEQGLLELKQDDKGWSIQVVRPGQRMNEATHFRGNGTEISNLLGSLVNLRGLTFIDARKKEKKARLGDALFRLTLKVGQVEREAVFYRDDEVPDLINAVTQFEFDPIFQLSEKNLDTMKQPFDTYRDRHAVVLDFPEAIETLEIHRPDETFTLKKREGRWRIDGEADVVLEETAAVSRLLTGLYNLQVQTFEDDLDPSAAKAGFHQPTLKLTLRGKDDKALGEIAFGARDGDRIFVTSSGQPFPFALPQSVLKRIPREKELIANAAAPPENAGQ